MRPLSLDYRRAAPLPGWIGIAVLLVALGMASQTGIHYRELMGEIARWEARLSSLERSLRRGPAVARQAGQPPGLEVKHAGEVVEQLARPWDDLFRAVESAGSEQVALLAIEPDAPRAQVKITGEAKNLAAMLGYIRLLGEKAPLDDVFLQSHQVQQQDPEKPVRFVLRATWRR